jgi:hypothetical protein
MPSANSRLEFKQRSLMFKITFTLVWVITAIAAVVFAVTFNMGFLFGYNVGEIPYYAAWPLLVGSILTYNMIFNW